MEHWAKMDKFLVCSRIYYSYAYTPLRKDLELLYILAKVLVLAFKFNKNGALLNYFRKAVLI